MERVERPWGWYETIDEGDRFKIKNIEVSPGQSISLQFHYHRSEHWVVVSGSAKVTINDKISVLNEGESTFIPLGAKHRLENPGEKEMILIEVQIGKYLKEDDIIRYDDLYSRV